MKRWNQRSASGDVYLFVTPEYNHSMPAVLKNAIDSVFASFGFRNKAAAFVSYSGGIAAGVRAIEHLAAVAVEAEMMPLRSAVIVPFVSTAFDEHGAPTNWRLKPQRQSCSTTSNGGALPCRRPGRKGSSRRPHSGNQQRERLINQFPPTRYFIEFPLIDSVLAWWDFADIGLVTLRRPVTDSRGVLLSTGHRARVANGAMSSCCRYDPPDDSSAVCQHISA